MKKEEKQEYYGKHIQKFRLYLKFRFQKIMIWRLCIDNIKTLSFFNLSNRDQLFNTVSLY